MGWNGGGANGEPWAAGYYVAREWLSTKVADRVVTDSCGESSSYLLGALRARRPRSCPTVHTGGGAVHPTILREYQLSPGSYSSLRGRLEPLRNNADLILAAYDPAAL